MRYLIKFLFIFLMAGFLITPVFVLAQDKESLPKIILFHGEECPHCIAERVFLNDLKKEFPDLEIKEYEVWHNKENQKIFEEKIKELKIGSGVPLTIVGDKYLVGFDKPETTGEQIKEMLGINKESSPNDVVLPIFGKINLKEYSLFFLTAIIGVLDGFNPCSMWALLTMITIILATGDKKKLWIVGWTFIFVSALSYFLFMSAWLNTFVFLSYIQIIRVVVGIVAIVTGVISINEFYTKKPNVCEVGSIEKQNKIVDRFKRIIANPSIFAIIIGVAGIAFSVNLVELMCSLGFPVVYAQALAIRDIPMLQRYLWIALYVFFYMLENIIVLLLAGVSYKFFIANEKYARYSRLIGGIAITILGILFIFKPDLLRF